MGSGVDGGRGMTRGAHTGAQVGAEHRARHAAATPIVRSDRSQPGLNAAAELLSVRLKSVPVDTRAP